jgi:hypothetical protein
MQFRIRELQGRRQSRRTRLVFVNRIQLSIVVEYEQGYRSVSGSKAGQILQRTSSDIFVVAPTGVDRIQDDNDKAPAVAAAAPGRGLRLLAGLGRWSHKLELAGHGFSRDLNREIIAAQRRKENAFRIRYHDGDP